MNNQYCHSAQSRQYFANIEPNTAFIGWQLNDMPEGRKNDPFLRTCAHVVVVCLNKQIQAHIHCNYTRQSIARYLANGAGLHEQHKKKLEHVPAEQCEKGNDRTQ